MASARKIMANRENAESSTGPKSEAGKLVSRTNATRHGLTARLIVSPLEDPAEWEAHRWGVLSDLLPVGYLEEELADRIASLLWRLRRVARTERAEIVAAIADAEDLAAPTPYDDLISDLGAKTDPKERERQRLARSARAVECASLPPAEARDSVTRYEGSLERSLIRTLHEFERIQARRSGGALPPPVAVDVTFDGDAPHL